MEPFDIEPFDIEPFDIEEDEDDPVCAMAGTDRVRAIAVASAAIVTRFIGFLPGFSVWHQTPAPSTQRGACWVTCAGQF